MHKWYKHFLRKYTHFIDEHISIIMDICSTEQTIVTAWHHTYDPFSKHLASPWSPDSSASTRAQVHRRSLEHLASLWPPDNPCSFPGGGGGGEGVSSVSISVSNRAQAHWRSLEHLASLWPPDNPCSFPGGGGGGGGEGVSSVSISVSNRAQVHRRSLEHLASLWPPDNPCSFPPTTCRWVKRPPPPTHLQSGADCWENKQGSARIKLAEEFHVAPALHRNRLFLYSSSPPRLYRKLSVIWDTFLCSPALHSNLGHFLILMIYMGSGRPIFAENTSYVVSARFSSTLVLILVTMTIP